MQLLIPTSTRRLAPSKPFHLHRTSQCFNFGKNLILKRCYSQPKRGSYASVQPEHIHALRNILSNKTSLLTSIKGCDATVESVSESELDSFNVDWMGKYRGNSKVVLKPKSTEEVSKIVKYCYDHNLAIVPQGGNTGLVGGSVPLYDEIILNVGNMNSIRSFDEVSGIVTCDAGIILENLDNYLAEFDYTVPLDLAAKGSCQIGGNIATNAGGLRVIRYGTLRGTVLGLEVVLPDGQILDSLSTLRKNNTGFDLKQLFIGSEGSIGVITGVSLLAAPKLKAKNVAVFSLDSYDAIQRAFIKTRQHVGEILSAFEFFDQAGHRIQQVHSRNPKKIFDAGRDAAFFVLVETTGSNKDHDDQKLAALLEVLIESEIVTDGVLAQDTAQFTSLWELRETITEAAGKTGKVFKYDVSLPTSLMYSVVEATRKHLAELGLYKGEGSDGKVKSVIGFGHFGDGNIHLNVISDSYDPEVQSALEPFVYEFVAKHRGSISAEHGLGLQKAPHIGYSQLPLNVDLMHQIKSILDPKKLFNPYKFVYRPPLE
ncbi:hypothetical protein Clacol_008947 [Clathrus columnatus]|uniref:FAD-binding PCMH-type domain-containing protein n=1 Tax=Clathrus columnatus TaxID=1419009 RepID=A0AAV5AP64_9AGAM|nr:hypothetical protein Clacol_008947 [Clathrus columnatus]